MSIHPTQRLLSASGTLPRKQPGATPYPLRTPLRYASGTLRNKRLAAAPYPLRTPLRYASGTLRKKRLAATPSLPKQQPPSGNAALSKNTLGPPM